jgi:hypothetical protein
MSEDECSQFLQIVFIRGPHRIVACLIEHGHGAVRIRYFGTLIPTNLALILTRWGSCVRRQLEFPSQKCSRLG